MKPQNVVQQPVATPTTEFKSGAQHPHRVLGHSLRCCLCAASVALKGPPFCVRPTLPKREKIISPALGTYGRSLRGREEPPSIQSPRLNIPDKRSNQECHQAHRHGGRGCFHGHQW
ncbi:hypothetical protein PBY51_018922 [Eleginops maclovinus]|uniref:Uncharacterized protein n=1 Tax=Eleginops maclovinus TaxID=56733 RepID=A0AAN8ASV6_ELEMC|nr:hypothetical protein PBY51_018922 [Eleginops maclovinus]